MVSQNVAVCHNGEFEKIGEKKREREKKQKLWSQIDTNVSDNFNLIYIWSIVQGTKKKSLILWITPKLHISKKPDSNTQFLRKCRGIFKMSGY